MWRHMRVHTGEKPHHCPRCAPAAGRFAARWARSVGRSHPARLGRGGLTVVRACRKLAGRAVTTARHRRDTSPRTCVPSTPASARSSATCSAPQPLHLDRRHAPECNSELTALLRCCVTALQPSYSLSTLRLRAEKRPHRAPGAAAGPARGAGTSSGTCRTCTTRRGSPSRSAHQASKVRATCHCHRQGLGDSLLAQQLVVHP